MYSARVKPASNVFAQAFSAISICILCSVSSAHAGTFDAVKGVYTGLSSGGTDTGDLVVGIIAGDGNYMFIYTPACCPTGVHFLDSGSGQIVAGNFSSPIDLNNNLYLYNDARYGTLSATYATGATLVPTFTYTASDITTANMGFIVGSDSPTSLGVLGPRSYGVQMSINTWFPPSSGCNTWQPNVSIDISPETGQLTGSIPQCFGPNTCSISGQLQPAPEVSAFLVSNFTLSCPSGSSLPASIDVGPYNGMAYFNTNNDVIKLGLISGSNNAIGFATQGQIIDEIFKGTFE